MLPTYAFVPNIMNWWLGGSSIDLKFISSQYYDSSAGGPGQSVTTYLSCSRASIGYVKNSDGTLTQFSNNVLRIGSGTGLLVEDARTNKIIHSQDFTDLGWTIATSHVSISGTTTAPDGTTTGQGIIPDATNNNHFVVENNSGGVYSLSASSATLSVYAKANGYNYIGVQLTSDNSYTKYFEGVFNLSNGTVEATSRAVSYTGSRSIESMGSGWYRCSITVDTTDANSSAESVFVVLSTNDPTVTYTGDGTSGVWLWGAQLEQASFPSSYIPTTTTAATRAADVVTCVGDLSSLLNTTNPRSIVADVLASFQPPSGIIIGSDGAGDESPLYGNADDSVGSYAVGTSLNATLGNSELFSTGAKVATGLNSSGRSLVGGGGTVASDANAMVALVTCFIGKGHVAGEAWFGYMRRLTFWNSRLADATLQTLTAP